MFNLTQKFQPETIPQIKRDRIWWLIIGRLIVVVLLLLGSIVWNNGRFDFTAAVPRGLILALLACVAFSILYAVVLMFNSKTRWQLSVQFFGDVFLVMWLVWATGNLKSPYISLYTVLICIASIFLGANGTLFIALICTLLFTSVSLLTNFGVIPHFDSTTASLSAAQALQIVGFHNAAFLVVGLLAAQLAARQTRSTVQLREATQNLASLRVLHERIIESIRSGLVTTDLDGTIYIYNRTAEEITGYEAAQVHGKNISHLLGNIEAQTAMALDAAKNDEHSPRFETDIFTPEGIGLRIGYGIAPLVSENGETTGLIITFQDLTEMRSMEESIRRKDRLAAVGRVAAGLAHEIRNPLGAMRGAIQVLHPSFAKESSQAQLMDIVLRESDRLNTIITNFLLYARPKVSDFEKTDLCQLIQDAVTLLRLSPDIRANHEIVESIPEEKIFAFADPVQLKQVFWNLARNALQAMPNGGKLTIHLQKVAQGRLQITFADTGCGMSPNQVERLFEPFSESKTGGTGLGLSIVYQIIRDHNGTISISSKEGEGTTIRLDLPNVVKSSANEAKTEKMLN